MFERAGNGLRVGWNAVDGAARYRVRRAGEEGEGIACTAPAVTLPELTANQFHALWVSAFDSHGEEGGAAGGASYLSFLAPAGAAPATGLAFGEFPADGDARAFAAQLDSDERNPGADLFLVRTNDAGIACVRVAERDYPRVVLDYVVRLPRR